MSRATEKAGTKSGWKQARKKPYGVKAQRNHRERSNAQKKT